jgi:hypothetical protein
MERNEEAAGRSSGSGRSSQRTSPELRRRNKRQSQAEQAAERLQMEQEDVDAGGEYQAPQTKARTNGGAHDKQVRSQPEKRNNMESDRQKTRGRTNGSDGNQGRARSGHSPEADQNAGVQALEVIGDDHYQTTARMIPAMER